MKVYELVEFLQNLPAGATVRCAANNDEPIYGDIISHDVDGQDAEAIVTFYFINEGDEE